MPRTFISDRGKIRSRRVTRLTLGQQRQVAAAIRTAREMALLLHPNTASNEEQPCGGAGLTRRLLV